jgi:hypothetical protein
MKHSKSIAIAGTCVLAAALLVTPSVQATALEAIGNITEIAVKGLIQSFWPVEHDKCFTLDRFDPACPPCL